MIELSSERNNAIDFIKCYAGFSVVCLHTAPFLNSTFSSGKYVFFIIDTLARFAVPFFFIVSGFLFVKKIIINKDNSSAYFFKYSKRIAKLYFGWTLFYFLYYMLRALFESYLTHTPFSSPYIPEWSTIPILKLIAHIFYLGYTGIHLWYLIALLWSMPLLFIFIKYQKLNTLLVISLILHIIGLLGNSYQGIMHLHIPTRNAMFFGLFYCTLGGFFAYYERLIQQKISEVEGSTFGWLFWLFCVIQLLERSILVNYFHGTINDEFFITTIPLSICIFFWAISKEGKFNKSSITVIGEKSLDIYVIHLFFLSAFGDLAAKIGWVPGATIYELLFTPFIFAVSYFWCLCSEKTKLWLNLYKGTIQK